MPCSVSDKVKSQIIKNNQIKIQINFRINLAPLCKAKIIDAATVVVTSDHWMAVPGSFFRFVGRTCQNHKIFCAAKILCLFIYHVFCRKNISAKEL